MNIKTIFGGVISVAIACLLSLIVIRGFERGQDVAPNPFPFMFLLACIGGVTGGAIAYPMPGTESNERSLTDGNPTNQE